MGAAALASLISSADDFLLQCPDSSHKKPYSACGVAPVTMATSERAGLLSSAFHVTSNSTRTRKVHVSPQTLPSRSEQVKGLARETSMEVCKCE